MSKQEDEKYVVKREGIFNLIDDLTPSQLEDLWREISERYDVDVIA